MRRKENETTKSRTSPNSKLGSGPACCGIFFFFFNQEEEVQVDIVIPSFHKEADTKYFHAESVYHVSLHSHKDSGSEGGIGCVLSARLPFSAFLSRRLSRMSPCILFREHQGCSKALVTTSRESLAVCMCAWGIETGRARRRCHFPVQ